MKLLIDGYSKQAKTIAANIKYCKDLEVLVYDPIKLEIDNMDLYLLQNLVHTEEEFSKELLIPNVDNSCFENINNKITYINEPQMFNGSYIKSTLNFNEALKWCDTFACCDTLEYDLIVKNDYNKTAESYVEKLNHIVKAKKSRKKLYLSHHYDKLFDKEAKYRRLINTKLTKKSLKHMKKLANGVYGSHSKNTDLKLVIGTYSVSGKFSLSMKLKEYYDTHGERTGIIFTEDTADLINSWYLENNKLDESLIINASREWNELTLDEYIEYLNYSVAYLESRGCKHILLQGQGTYGTFNLTKCYINENKKVTNIANRLLEQAVGCNTVALAMCTNQLDRFYDIAKYFKLTGVPVTDVYINTYDHTSEYKDDYLEFNGKKLSINKVVPVNNLINTIVSIRSYYPTINYFTNDSCSQLIDSSLDKYDSGLLDQMFKCRLETVFSELKDYYTEYYQVDKIEDYKEMLNKLVMALIPMIDENFKNEDDDK